MIRRAVKSPLSLAERTGSVHRVPVDGSGSGSTFPCASRRIHESESITTADDFPGPDANFQAWQSNFVVYANANLVALGLAAPDMAPITAPQPGWAMAFPAHVAAVNADVI